MEWCVEQPCMAKNDKCCLMVHVDDVSFAVMVFTGKTNFCQSSESTTTSAIHSLEKLEAKSLF